MTYIKKEQKTAQHTEAKLPQWKRWFFRSLLTIGLLPAHTIATPINFDKEIQQFLHSEIKSYLRSVNSQSQRQDIELFIPKGSENLSCDELQITRSQSHTPPAGRVSISVSCPSPAWRFRASAKVSVWINLVAAKHTLNRGKVLNKQDLEYKSVDLGKHRHQGETGIDQLVGLTVKREIDKGTVISTRYLEKQYLINKNEHISLQINTATFSANVKAIALEDGQLGEVINVKNLSSKKVVQGRVIAQGVAEATF